MRQAMIFRMRAPAAQAVVEAIARALEQMRRPNSGHSFGHTVVNVTHYPGAGSRELGYEDDHFNRNPAAFWHAYASEADVLADVQSLRGGFLFGALRYAIPELTPTIERWIAAHVLVADRAAERRFLGECAAELRPLFESAGGVSAGHSAWADLTRAWRWANRYASGRSFPFLRPGLDVVKAYTGFDLHGEHGKIWYAIARVHF